MKIVMLRKYGYTEEEQDSVSVVGIYEDNTPDEKILDDVFLEYGYISDKKYSIHSKRTILQNNISCHYYINGAIEIHSNLSVSGLLKDSLYVY